MKYVLLIWLVIGLLGQGADSPLQGQWKTYVPELNRFRNLLMDAEMTVDVASDAVTITRHFVHRAAPPVSEAYRTDGRAQVRRSDGASVTARWATSRRLEVLAVQPAHTVQDTYQVSDDDATMLWTTVHKGPDDHASTEQREYRR